MSSEPNTPQSSRSKALKVALGAAAAVTTAVLLLWRPARVEETASPTTNEPPGATGTDAAVSARPAGVLSLHVDLLRDGQSEDAASGGAFRAGDRLRFRISTPGRGFVSILRVATDGALSTAWPPEGAARALPASEDLLLDDTLELDAAPGHETLWLVHCASAGSCVRVHSAMMLQCPQDCVRTPFFLEKPR
jgi:hypothetical protein